MRVTITFTTEENETPENFAYAVRQAMPGILTEVQAQGLMLRGDVFSTAQLLEDDKRWRGNSEEIFAEWAVTAD